MAMTMSINGYCMILTKNHVYNIVIAWNCVFKQRCRRVYERLFSTCVLYSKLKNNHYIIIILYHSLVMTLLLSKYIKLSWGLISML